MFCCVRDLLFQCWQDVVLMMQRKIQGKKAASESDLDYVKEKGTLVVGITNFEPMDYQDEEGEWIGFDADMAKAFGESLGVGCRVCGD